MGWRTPGRLTRLQPIPGAPAREINLPGKFTGKEGGKAERAPAQVA